MSMVNGFLPSAMLMRRYSIPLRAVAPCYVSDIGGLGSLSYSVFWTAISTLHLPHLMYRSAGSAGSSCASRIIIRLWGDASPTRNPQLGHMSLTTFLLSTVCFRASPVGPFAIGILLLLVTDYMRRNKAAPLRGGGWRDTPPVTGTSCPAWPPDHGDLTSPSKCVWQAQGG